MRLTWCAAAGTISCATCWVRNPPPDTNSSLRQAASAEASRRHNKAVSRNPDPGPFWQHHDRLSAGRGKSAQLPGALTREEGYSGEQIRDVAFTGTLDGKGSNWPIPPLGDTRRRATPGRIPGTQPGLSLIHISEPT